MRVWGVAYKGERYGVAFDCPGCTLTHVVNVAPCAASPNAPIWQWNGSMDRPTFSPSLLVTSGHHVTGQPAAQCNHCREGVPCVRCHSFVREGRIEFLGDCTHALAGQTVDLPELEVEVTWDEA